MLQDQINELRQPASATDFSGNRLTNIGTPVDATDAANKSYVDSTASPETIRASLLAAGSNPLDVTALRGQLSQVQRAKIRVVEAGAALPTYGQPFELLYFTDTGTFYYWNATTSEWVIM